MKTKDEKFTPLASSQQSLMRALWRSLNIAEISLSARKLSRSSISNNCWYEIIRLLNDDSSFKSFSDVWVYFYIRSLVACRLCSRSALDEHTRSRRHARLIQLNQLRARKYIDREALDTVEMRNAHKFTTRSNQMKFHLVPLTRALEKRFELFVQKRLHAP